MFEIKSSIQVLIVVTIVLLFAVPDEKLPKKKPKTTYKSRRSSSYPPLRSLPWFDKEYQERKKREDTTTIMKF